MSEPLSKRLFAQTGVEGEIDQEALDEHNRRYEELGREASSGVVTSHEAPKQEPMIPGFEEPPAKKAPEMVGRVSHDALAEFDHGVLEKFTYVATGEYVNVKTGERFVCTPGTDGGVLYTRD